MNEFFHTVAHTKGRVHITVIQHFQDDQSVMSLTEQINEEEE